MRFTVGTLIVCANFPAREEDVRVFFAGELVLSQVKPLLVLVQRYFVPETLVLAPTFVQVAPDFEAVNATLGIVTSESEHSGRQNSSPHDRYHIE
jgi:hypothetical protein